ncbi:MAG: hypothetical protein WCI04_05400 [archaeon]
MAIDFIGALTGEDLFLTIALILFIIYFIWIYAWAKKQIGPGLGLLLAIVISFILFYNFPELIWVPLLLFLWSVFGKELLERVPKSK